MNSVSRPIVDDTDRRIVNALLGNGRADISEIAADANVAAPTVSRRLDELEDNGVISGFTPIVGYEKLGYEVTVVLQFDVAGDGLAAVVDTLREHDRMIDVYEVTGSTDVVAIGKFVDTDEMHDRLGELLTHPSVETVTVGVVRETIREHKQLRIAADNTQ